MDVRDDNHAASADRPNPESRARETIADILAGNRLTPKTVTDVGDTVDRAKRDAAVRRAIPTR